MEKNHYKERNMTSSLKLPPAESCVNLILATMSPLQGIIDRPGLTHEFCNRQALSILRNDGFTQYADFFMRYLPELNLGVYWADKGWKNVHHYFEPCTGKGLWQFTHAIDNFNLYYQTALSTLEQYDFKKAAFFLGAAAHLVQDLCVPHHARAKLFCGHKQYEGWVQQRCTEYAVVSQGTYSEGRPAPSLIMSNAHTAADFFDWVKYEGDETCFEKATPTLLSLAQRTTAGLFWQFATEAVKLGRATRHPWLLPMSVA
jgi:phospholipase C